MRNFGSAVLAVVIISWPLGDNMAIATEIGLEHYGNHVAFIRELKTERLAVTVTKTTFRVVQDVYDPNPSGWSDYLVLSPSCEQCLPSIPQASDASLRAKVNGIEAAILRKPGFKGGTIYLLNVAVPANGRASIMYEYAPEYLRSAPHDFISSLELEVNNIADFCLNWPKINEIKSLQRKTGRKIMLHVISFQYAYTVPPTPFSVTINPEGPDEVIAACDLQQAADGTYELHYGGGSMTYPLIL